MTWTSRVPGTVLLCVCAAASAYAGSASSYSDVLGALQDGRPVRVVTDLKNCEVGEEKRAGPPFRGGLLIDSFMVSPDGSIGFSDVHETLDPTGQPVTEYVRFRLTQDNHLVVKVARKTVTGIEQREDITCRLPAGATFVW